jgi:hypothetical protein
MLQPLDSGFQPLDLSAGFVTFVLSLDTSLLNAGSKPGGVMERINRLLNLGLCQMPRRPVSVVHRD